VRVRLSSHVLIGIFLGVLFPLAAAAARATDSHARNDGQTPAVAGPATEAPAPEGIPEYAIGPGDVLALLVWKEPELTTDVTVRQDGRISVPLLGDLSASGLSPEQLSADLREKLGRFVEAPHVTVSVTQANSARFFIVGQVTAAGVFPLTGRITVLQALALAGGFTTFAKRDKILVIRDTTGEPEFIRVNYKKLEGGKDIRENILLRPGDTVVVP